MPESEKKKVLLIANPKAGMIKLGDYPKAVARVFEKSGYEVTLKTTRWKKDAAYLARSYAGGADLVVCCGGDGTLNEVVSGMRALPQRLPLGYIPVGTTNDFAASLGLSRDYLKAAKNIVEGMPTELDVGSFNGHLFTYVASFGAFTESSYATPQNVKNIMGHAAYVLEALKSLQDIRPIPMRVVSEERVCEDAYVFGAVSNSTSIAGMVKLDAGTVSLTDGEFEVILLKMPESVAAAQSILNALVTRQYDSEYIEFFHTKRVEFYPRQRIDWSLDGEFCEGGEKITVENLHKALTVIR